MAIKKLQCNSCGSNSVFKLNDTTYKCNYCQTEFKIEKSNKQNPPLVPSNQSSKSFGKLIFFVFGFLTFIGMIIFFLFLKNSQISKPLSNSNKYWNLSGNEAILPIKIKGNDYVLSLLKFQTPLLDSSIIRLKIIEPISKNIIKDTVFQSGSWHKLSFKTRIQYFSKENLFYTIINDTGFYVYDVPSLKLINSHYSISLKHKALYEGIANIRKDNYKNYIIFKDISDRNYYYDVKYDSLITSDEYDKRFKKCKFQESGVFFTHGEHPFLVFADKWYNFYDQYTIPISDTNNLKKVNELNFYKINSVKLLSTKRFYHVKICGRYNKGLIFAYKESVKPGTTIYLSYVDKNGEFKWKYTDSLLQKYLDGGDYIKFFQANRYENKLILYTESYPIIVYCFNIESGKPEWYFSSLMTLE
jgi:hypothetical protein